VVKVGEEIHVWAEARSFLHKQVRSLVGSLVQVGVGRWSEQDLVKALEARNSAACGPLAPPHGLTLEAITYA
jgi:tRNA pseudouridine38-40 synthase